ncbi:T9SS sorting signal type C domain-containing protein [Flavobacterium sp. LBUM151]
MTIYNVSGKAIYTKKKIENTESEINLSLIGNQLLLVKTILENGNATTNKIVF